MKQSSQPRRLTIEEIAVAMEACLANAGELLDEADLLSQANHLARAYFLFHAACEELAKFFIFDMAGRRIAQENPPNWKRFWQRLRDHDSKLAQVEVRNRFPTDSVLNEPNELVEAGMDLLFAYGIQPRNTSLYVELEPRGAFRKPSSIDWSVVLPGIKAVASRLDRMARKVGTSANSIAISLRETPTQTDRDQVLGVSTRMVERLQAAGVSKESALQHLRKFIGK